MMQLNTSASFEVIHSALDLLMTKIGAVHKQHYNLKECEDNKYFPKRSAAVMLEGK